MAEDKTMIEQVDLRRHPQEIEVRAEEISRRKTHLLGIGFSEEWVDSLMDNRPTLYNSAVVDGHITGLQEFGFTNPNKMIESSLAILGYNLEENIKPKIEGLRQLGFTNPNKMIESSPAILGLNLEENIKRRINLLSKLIKLYQLPFSATFLMEQDSALFSSKIDKMLVVVRVLRHYKVEPPTLNESTIRRLLHSNLEDTLVVLDQGHNQNETITDFLRRVKGVKDLKLPKEEKRQIIKVGLAEFEKIKSRYLKGYPSE